MTVEFWLEFLGWMTLVNFGILMFATVFLALFRGWAMSIHSAMTGVDQAALPTLYFSYLGNLKIAWIVLNLVPYLVLRIAM
jgi:hypothetical protein